MDADVKRMWVAALRSGEYKQGTGYLHQDDKFCCLGVLCDIAVQNNVINKPMYGINDDIAVYEDRYGDEDVNRYNTILPMSVMRWAGLNDANPTVSSDDGDAFSLAVYNDEGMPFVKIADLIERHL